MSMLGGLMVKKLVEMVQENGGSGKPCGCPDDCPGGCCEDCECGGDE